MYTYRWQNPTKKCVCLWYGIHIQMTQMTESHWQRVVSFWYSIQHCLLTYSFSMSRNAVTCTIAQKRLSVAVPAAFRGVALKKKGAASQFGANPFDPKQMGQSRWLLTRSYYIYIYSSMSLKSACLWSDEVSNSMAVWGTCSGNHICHGQKLDCTILYTHMCNDHQSINRE